jgi:rhodanese-related sulfurtransferase
MAAQTCKVLLKEQDVLSGKLLLFDYTKFSFQTLKFSKIQQNFDTLPLESYEFLCVTSNKIDKNQFASFIQNPLYDLIDVREESEFLHYNIGGKNFPLADLLSGMTEITFKPHVILICNTGKRSAIAQKNILANHKVQTTIVSLNDL